MLPRKQNRGWFLLPGANYIGPGNSMEGAPPTNQVDYAAYYHDVDPDFKYFKHNAADERFIERVKRVKPKNRTERVHKTAALSWHYFKKRFFPHDANLKNFTPGETLSKGTSATYPYKIGAMRAKYRPLSYRKKRKFRAGKRARPSRYGRKRRSRYGKKRLSTRRGYRRGKKLPIVMNQQVGLKYRKHAAFIPKVAACKVKCTWTKNLMLSLRQTYRLIQNIGTSTPTTQDCNLVNPGFVDDVNTHQKTPYFALTSTGQKIEIQGRHYYTNRRKIVQLFFCGTLPSVAARPSVVEYDNVGLPLTNVVQNQYNPISNPFGLEQKPGYPMEIMADRYSTCRVAANKFNIRFTWLGHNMDSTRQLKSNFVMCTGVYWPKNSNWSVDPQLGPGTNVTDEQQIARDIYDRTFEQMRVQPGVKTYTFGKKNSLNVTAYVPAERMGEMRYRNWWKWGQNPTVQDTKLDTKPLYTSKLVDYTEADGLTYNVKVPYYNLDANISSMGYWNVPIFFIVIYDRVTGMPVWDNQTNDTPGYPRVEELFVPVMVQVKETKYMVFADPKFQLRSQQWTQGVTSTGDKKYLPDRARIFPQTVLTTFPVANVDQSGTTINYSDTDIFNQSLLQDMNTGGSKVLHRKLF